MNYLRHPFMGITIHSAPSILIVGQIGVTSGAMGFRRGTRRPSVAGETLLVEMLNSGFITHSTADPLPLKVLREHTGWLSECLLSWEF
jgi:hypothetical protein